MNQQEVLVKLATVRLAINHVLRTRAMQKQADGPYKRFFYPNPYDVGRPWNPLRHNLAEGLSSPADAEILNAAKQEERARYNYRVENPGMPPYLSWPPNVLQHQTLHGQPELTTPYLGIWPLNREPTEDEQNWIDSADAVKRTLKNRKVVGDPNVKSKPHHLDSNATKDENLAYMIQAYDGDPHRQGEWDNLENDWQRLYGEPSGVFDSKSKPKKPMGPEPPADYNKPVSAYKPFTFGDNIGSGQRGVVHNILDRNGLGIFGDY